MIIKVGDRVHFQGDPIIHTVTFVVRCTCGEAFFSSDKEIEALFGFTCICGATLFIPRNSHYTHFQHISIVEEDKTYEKLLESL